MLLKSSSGSLRDSYHVEVERVRILLNNLLDHFNRVAREEAPCEIGPAFLPSWPSTQTKQMKWLPKSSEFVSVAPAEWASSLWIFISRSPIYIHISYTDEMDVHVVWCLKKSTIFYLTRYLKKPSTRHLHRSHIGFEVCSVWSRCFTSCSSYIISIIYLTVVSQETFHTP